MEKKLDPYAALRFKEFNIFLILRFILVFGWSMQFIIIEWEVYRITKDPLSLGIIGLMEVIPAPDFPTAGIIYGNLNEMSSEDTLNFAVASSALAHTIHGDLNLVTLSEVNSIVKGDTSGRVQR